jgi:phenylacetate-CoA ligase
MHLSIDFYNPPQTNNYAISNEEINLLQFLNMKIPQMEGRYMSDLRIIWYLNQLRKNQWLRTSEIEKIQSKKLRAIIKHAYDNVKFYHQIFDSIGIKPEDIKTAQDLSKLPIITKVDIQKNFLRFVARGVNLAKCEKYRTSGSTGIPLTIISDKKADDFRAAVFGRPFFECGLRFLDKTIYIGDPRHFPRSKHWYQHLGFMRRIYLSAYDQVEGQIPLLQEYCPDAIFGYSSYIYLLARTIHERGINEIFPRLIFGTAELLDEETRRFINSVFQVKMFDLFGCVEVERTAWECSEHVGYHMDIDSVVMEFIRDGEVVAPGERGEIVYTCLYNYAMPLIRYNIGDVGIPSDEQCPCGRGLPLMKHIEGRVDDFILTPNGRIICPTVWTITLRNIPGIAQYRVIQERKDELVVQLVKGKGFSQNTIHQVQEEITKVLGNDVQIKPVIVEQITRDRSGKIRAVISKVSKRLP